MGLLGLSACFNPQLPTGAPCSTASPCPSGQACIADRCSIPQPGPLDGGMDGPVDAVPSAMDRDGDQIPDDQDNCPDKASPDRGDEDGDRVGDVCDPCPIDLNNTDLDGDGVAGSCDPRPDNGGDAIVVFEGFHRAPSLDIWTLIGKVEHSGDALALISDAGNHASISLTDPTVMNGTVTASVIVDATVGNGFAATSVVLPFDPGNDNGLFCELYAEGESFEDRTLSIFDGPGGRDIGLSVFAWSTATPYRLALTRSGNNYRCSATTADGTQQTATGTTMSMRAPLKVGIDVDGANASVAWLLVVSSP